VHHEYGRLTLATAGLLLSTVFVDGVDVVDPDGTPGVELRHGATDRCHAASPAVRLDVTRQHLPQVYAAGGARARRRLEAFAGDGGRRSSTQGGPDTLPRRDFCPSTHQQGERYTR